jgi:hypothetical protein
VQRCRVKWGPTIERHGRKYDHALIHTTFKGRIAMPKKEKMRDWSFLRQDRVREAFDDTLKTLLATKEHLKDHDALAESVRQAAEQHIPDLEPIKRIRPLKPNAKALLEIRVKLWKAGKVNEARTVNKQFQKAATKDQKEYLNEIATAIQEATDRGDCREVWKHGKQMKLGGTYCTLKPDEIEGKPVTCDTEIVKLFEKRLRDEFKAITPKPALRPSNPPPFPEELFQKAVKRIKAGKAMGPDGIPAEAIKNSMAIQEAIHDVAVQAWNKLVLPNHFVDVDIVMLYKKLSKNDPYNYRPVGLLNHAFKVISCMLLMYVQTTLEPKIMDSQAGFRPHRGTRDSLFILSKAIEMATNQKLELTIVFIDFIGAFPSLNHDYLMNSLQTMGMDTHVVNLITVVYEEAMMRIKMRSNQGPIRSERVSQDRGIVTGDILSPLLFCIALHSAFQDMELEGITLTAKDGSSLTLKDLLYADDIALTCNSIEQASRALQAVSDAAEPAGLFIHAGKTVALPINPKFKITRTTEEDCDKMGWKTQCEHCKAFFPGFSSMPGHLRTCTATAPQKPKMRVGNADTLVKEKKRALAAKQLPQVQLNGKGIPNVAQAIYLGSLFTTRHDTMDEVKRRIAIGWSCNRSYIRVYKSKVATRGIKLRFFNATWMSVVFYGCETWKVTPAMVTVLTSALTRSYCFAVGGWKKRTENQPEEEYWEEARVWRAKIRVQARKVVLGKLRLTRNTYLGHILRRDNESILKQAALAGNGPVDCGRASPRLGTYAKYEPGTLLGIFNGATLTEIEGWAQDRDQWKKDWCWKPPYQVKNIHELVEEEDNITKAKRTTRIQNRGIVMTKDDF